MLHFGPETGVHTIGWWRSPQRLKTLLTLGAVADDLGCVGGARRAGCRVGHAHPGPAAGLGAAARPRALVFDRARHARPEVVIVAASEEDGERRRVMTDAVRRYKEIVGELTAVAEELREKDNGAGDRRWRGGWSSSTPRWCAPRTRAAAVRGWPSRSRWENVLEALWDRAVDDPAARSRGRIPTPTASDSTSWTGKPTSPRTT